MPHYTELMNKLDISETEAKELIAFDKAVDKGADPYPLSQEQKKVEKKMRQVDRAPTVYKFTQRERKPNNDKQFLIDLFNAALVNSDNEGFGELPKIEITNPEREIVFWYNDKKYKMVLSAPRN